MAIHDWDDFRIASYTLKRTAPFEVWIIIRLVGVYSLSLGGCYILIPDQWIWTQEKLAKVMGKEKVEEKEAKLDELGWQITSSHVVQYIYIYIL
jgi:hypothetical protein